MNRWGREDGFWKEMVHWDSGIGLSDSLHARRTEMTSCLQTCSPARRGHGRYLKLRGTRAGDRMGMGSAQAATSLVVLLEDSGLGLMRRLQLGL